MSDRLRQIEAFLQVAKTRNFTRAGNVLGLSQPALSALVSKFEDELGIKLFHRTTRSVSLTEAGANFLPNAERILMDVHLSIYELKEAAMLIDGRIRIAAPSSLCSSRLPGWIGAFGEEYPGISISVFERPEDTILDMVANAQCDLALSVEAKDRDDIIFRPVFKDRLVLLCRDDHAFADFDILPWQMLDTHGIIALEPGTSVRQSIEEASFQARISLQTTSEVQSVTTAIGFVRAGLGLTVLGESDLIEFAMDDLAVVELEEPTMPRSFGILHSVEKPLSPAASELAKRIERLR
ncbi:MAG: LysR family transcriptional regulator [Pseudomonadota bacterium]